MKKSILVCLALMATLLAPATAARQSGDPFNAYCIVDKVIGGQDDQHRSTVQVWATCAVLVSIGMDHLGNYVAPSTPDAFLYSRLLPPRRGYLYYFATNEETVSKEWPDLKAMAGTGEVIGLGSRQVPSYFRWADEKPQSPDEYPAQVRFSKVTSNPEYAKVVADLKKAVAGR